MKIKSDFVTNSSSSNFVIGFPFVPKNEEDVHRMLFGGDEEVFISGYWEDSYSSKEISQTIFDLMKDQTPNNEEDIIDSINEGWFEGMPKLNDFCKNGTDWMGNIDAYTKACKEKAKELAQKYLLGFPDLSFYTFSFDDDSPYMAMLESGEAFSRMCYERISCH